MNAQQTANIVQLLRQDPLHYRNFGPYWWHVKRELKAQHTGKVLPCLAGDYEDTTDRVTNLYDGKSAAELDRLALETAADHAFHKRNSPHHLHEDGESYFIYDPDVGM